MFVEDEVAGGVPEASGDGGAWEDGAQLVDVFLQLGQVILIVAPATLVVDDEDSAVRAAHDAVGTQVLDAVGLVNSLLALHLGIGLLLFRVHSTGDGALAIDTVGGVEPGGDRAGGVHDLISHSFMPSSVMMISSPI